VKRPERTLAMVPSCGSSHGLRAAAIRDGLAGLAVMHVLGGCPGLATLVRRAGRVDPVIVLGGPCRQHRLRPGGFLAVPVTNPELEPAMKGTGVPSRWALEEHGRAHSVASGSADVSVSKRPAIAGG
jgi:hypothetical protein